jgi:hypothetical protein
MPDGKLEKREQKRLPSKQRKAPSASKPSYLSFAQSAPLAVLALLGSVVSAPTSNLAARVKNRISTKIAQAPGSKSAASMRIVTPIAMGSFGLCDALGDT